MDHPIAQQGLGLVVHGLDCGPLQESKDCIHGLSLPPTGWNVVLCKDKKLHTWANIVASMGWTVVSNKKLGPSRPPPTNWTSMVQLAAHRPDPVRVVV